MIGGDNKWQYLISRYRDVVLNHWFSLVSQMNWPNDGRTILGTPRPQMLPYRAILARRWKTIEKDGASDSTGRINANWARQRNDELASKAAAADVVAEIDRLDGRLLLIRNVKGI